MPTSSNDKRNKNSKFSEKRGKQFGKEIERKSNRKSSDFSKNKKFDRKNEFNNTAEKPYEHLDDKKFDKKRKFNNSEEKPFKNDSSKRANPKYNRQKPNRSKPKSVSKSTDEKGLIRLNKYIANSGVASRREADELIQAGEVKVNGKIVTELGTKISENDVVQYCGETLRKETLKYLLLNKPKGYITTTDDPLERRTVMLLIENACRERIYPVGRLDRNTTGLLLFTNDGDLAKKLSHPRHNIRKIYSATLDKNLTSADMNKIKDGIELEDGFIAVDDIEYTTNAKSKKEVGVILHSGKNRIVRRIFEHLGYQVLKLDRVGFAGLTKKDIPRGKWRFLTEKEVNFLKMIK